MIFSNDLLVILYVKSVPDAQEFYQTLLNVGPCLETKEMVEFPITECTRLGLMASDRLVSILDTAVENPNTQRSVPRCELYIYVDQPQRYYQQALALGATGLSSAAYRNWGDYVAYCQDPDGNVIAFASRGLAEG